MSLRMGRGKGVSSGIFKAVRWPLLLAANGALLLVVGVSAGRETYQQWQVDQDIRGLQSQVTSLEGRRIQLLDTIQKFNSADAIDEQARRELDVKKPGERVVVLQGFHPTAGQETSLNSQAPSASSDPQKWFAYFFLH